MSQRAVFFATSIAGVALFGAVAFMQLNSRAFTRAAPIDLDSYLYSEVLAKPTPQAPASTPPRPEPGVIVLPPVEVLGRPTRSAPTQPALHETTVPCSPWREIGPQRVDEGVPTGSIQVRDLC